MKAVIMAGGRGKRLRPLTCNLPKPMVPVLNRPLMEHIIKLLKRQGITEIGVTTCYLPRIIEDYFGNGEKWGVRLHYFAENKPLGTAGSVQNASSFLDETFVVISGDALTDYELTPALDFHSKKGALGTLVLNREDIPLDYGVVMTDKDRRINRFLEKPDWGRIFTDTVNTGIYILEPDIFNYYPKNQKFDFSKDLFPLLMEKKEPLFGLPLEGYWNDIGSLQAYYQAQFDLLEGKLDLPLDGARQLEKGVWIEEGVEIGSEVRWSAPLYLGANSIIEDRVFLESVIMGEKNRLLAESSLKRTVLWNHNKIGDKAELRGAILGSGINLGAESRVFDRTAIGDNVQIKENTRITPGIKIWPERKVGSDQVVKEDLVWSTGWQESLSRGEKICGKGNIELTPEVVSRLATAYASTLNPGDTVLLSSSNEKFSCGLRLLSAGALQCSGLNIIDLGKASVPALRRSISRSRAAGGIYFSMEKTNDQELLLTFFNSRGLEVMDSSRRAVEKELVAPDYNRPLPDEAGSYSLQPERRNRYLEELLTYLNQDLIKEAGFTLSLEQRVEQVEVVPVDAYLRRLEIQLKEKGEFSFSLSSSGEELTLYHPKGEKISPEDKEVLLAYLQLEKGSSKLVLPYSAPRVIERMARRYGAEVEYSPLSFSELINRHYKAGEDQLFPFYPRGDGLAFLGLLLEVMAREKMSFNHLLASLPAFHFHTAEYPCNWKEKGKVMRKLAEEQEGRGEQELIDGLRFEHEKGWALVVPDRDDPVFKIVVEGEDEEVAESLTGFYLRRLQEIINRATS